MVTCPVAAVGGIPQPVWWRPPRSRAHWVRISSPGPANLPDLFLPVHRSPMPHLQHQHHHFSILDPTDHPPVSGPVSPELAKP